MYKSHPVSPAPFDEGLDFPSRLTRERRKTEDAIPVSVLTYLLDDDDVAAIEAAFGAGVLTDRAITVTTGYRHNGGTWAVPYKEIAAVDHLRASLDLPSTTKTKVDSASSIKELITALEEMEAPTAAVSKVMEKVGAWRKQRLVLALIDALESRRPGSSTSVTTTRCLAKSRSRTSSVSATPKRYPAASRPSWHFWIWPAWDSKTFKSPSRTNT